MRTWGRIPVMAGTRCDMNEDKLHNELKGLILTQLLYSMLKKQVSNPMFSIKVKMPYETLGLRALKNKKMILTSVCTILGRLSLIVTIQSYRLTVFSCSA